MKASNVCHDFLDVFYKFIFLIHFNLNDFCHSRHAVVIRKKKMMLHVTIVHLEVNIFHIQFWCLIYFWGEIELIHNTFSVTLYYVYDIYIVAVHEFRSSDILEN